MAYEEPRYRRRAAEDVDPDATRLGARFVDDYADEPVAGMEESDPRAYPPPRRVPPAALGDVFDDPAHGDPGRDRLAVHVGWEAVLLLAVAVLALLVYRADPGVLRGTGLRTLLIGGTTLGLLALAAGLSLRTAAPNLALGPMAVAAALHYAENGDRGLVAAVWPLALAAVALGLLVALLAVGLHVPAWAASLAVGLALVVFIERRLAPVRPQGTFDPGRFAVHLAAGFAAVAVLSGLLGTIKAVRRTVGRFRPVADPARRRGVGAAVLVTAATTVSMVFAAAAGVLLAAGATEPVRPDAGLVWTALALGVALLGGTSAFGRRGGVFGTLLGVALVTLFLRYVELRGWRVTPAGTAAAVLALGLLVTRLVESYGRPRGPGEGDEEWDADDSADDWDERSRSWSGRQSADAHLDSWGPDPWRDDR
jgi:ribose/xylose/arabinose/galactoside ABC-type transport system permease subunit